MVNTGFRFNRASLENGLNLFVPDRQFDSAGHNQDLDICPKVEDGMILKGW